jgi:trehalose 6-phosphate phosphatase
LVAATTIGEIVAALRARLPQVLVAVDFDGTLAPIVADPTRSQPVSGAIAALADLARHGAAVAVITGRDAETAVRLGGLDRVPGIRVAGLYGIETWYDGRLSTVDEPPELNALRERLPAVVAAAATDPRVWIEDKRLSLVVHARKAANPAQQLALVREPVVRLAGELGLEPHPGRGVLEIRIPGYDKGRALRRLITETGRAAVLFAGDDIGDLPAIEEVRRMAAAGAAAFAVAIGAADGTELADAADVTVADPGAMVALLHSLAGA